MLEPRQCFGAAAKSREVGAINLVDFDVVRFEFESTQQKTLNGNVYTARLRCLVSQRKRNERRQTSMMIGRITHQEVDVSAGL